MVRSLTGTQAITTSPVLSCEKVSLSLNSSCLLLTTNPTECLFSYASRSGFHLGITGSKGDVSRCSSSVGGGEVLSKCEGGGGKVLRVGAPLKDRALDVFTCALNVQWKDGPSSFGVPLPPSPSRAEVKFPRGSFPT